MDPKPWYKSSILWVNLAMILLAALNTATQLTNADGTLWLSPAVISGIGITVNAITLVLRTTRGSGPLYFFPRDGG